MAQQNCEKSGLPDYPTNDFYQNVLLQRPVPPSYEESQRPMSHAAQFQQPQYQTAGQQYTYAPTPAMYAPQAYMGVPHYAAQAYALPASQWPPVLTLAQGAEIRTTATGAVCIPPPPPGCAPTPAQWAAMQGQQVVVKEQKKRSFFS